MRRLVALVAIVSVLSFGGFALAQSLEQQVAVSPGQNDAVENAAETQSKIKAEQDQSLRQVEPSRMASLVFTFWEHTAIKDARRSRGSVRTPTAAELSRDLGLQEEDLVKPPPEARNITLGGIVYLGRGDWTIWLNGKRVTPKALPDEAIDLSVHKEYIELKWFDEWTNKIYPVRLRSHQRFNLDTRIFLPG